MGLLLSRTHLHGENKSAQSRFTRTDNQGSQPPRHQILRIDREGIIDDVISHDNILSLGLDERLHPPPPPATYLPTTDY